MQTLRLEYLDADDLEGNPSNWKFHPPQQLAPLKASLAEVGWAGALLFNERTQRLLDGHARQKLSAGQKVPVLIGDWSEEHEKLILATLDPLAALAEADQDKLDALLQEVSTNSEALGKMLEELAIANGINPLNDGKEFDESAADDVEMITCPHCGKDFPR